MKRLLCRLGGTVLAVLHPYFESMSDPFTPGERQVTVQPLEGQKVQVRGRGDQTVLGTVKYK